MFKREGMHLNPSHSKPSSTQQKSCGGQRRRDTQFRSDRQPWRPSNRSASPGPSNKGASPGPSNRGANPTSALLAALAVLVVICLASVSSAVAQQDELDRVRSEQEQLRQEIRDASAQVDAAESRVAAARQRVNESQQLVDEAQQRADAATQVYGQIHADLHLLQDEANELEADIDEAEAEILGLHDDIEELAISRYIYAGQAPSLFDSEDVARQIFLDALAQFISQGNQDLIEDYRLALDDLEIRKQRLQELQELQARRDAEAQEAVESLNATFADLAEVSNSLRSDLNALNAELAGLESVLASLQASLPTLEQEETRLEAEIAAAKARALLEAERAKQAAASSSRATFTGEITIRSGPNWVCPVAGPFTHYKDWRAPRAYGGWHKGNDLFAPRGTPLVSTESGWVIHKFNSVGGNSVHITADSGNYYYYTHLDSYENVGPAGGHWLEAGTVVGYLGNTGNAITTPPHLHFEFHLGGKGNYVDPYPYVRSNCF